MWWHVLHALNAESVHAPISTLNAGQLLEVWTKLLHAQRTDLAIGGHSVPALDSAVAAVFVELVKGHMRQLEDEAQREAPAEEEVSS
jgi:anti-anti-sigma regulatory factor